MQIHLITVSNRVPEWVKLGYEDYAKRFSKEIELILKEIPLAQRGKNADPKKWVEIERERIAAVIPPNAHVVALDERGKSLTTLELSQLLSKWMQNGKPVALLVGGPDGLAESLKAKADEKLSLSPLTLPHPLVRVIVAEQLYRAWSVLKNHPYHRE